MKNEIDIESYYHKYGPMVYRRCVSILHDDDRAYDALQEVFMKLITNSAKLDGYYPSSLLFTIATNVCLNMLRADRHAPAYINSDDIAEKPNPVSDNIENRVADTDLLDRIFSRHKESTRLIAYLHYRDGMTLKEVAEIAGLSISGVRKRLRNLKLDALQYISVEEVQ